MKRFILSLTAFMMLFPLLGQAKAYKVEEVPIVHLKDSANYVCNPDKVLPDATVQTIDTMLPAWASDWPLPNRQYHEKETFYLGC